MECHHQNLAENLKIFITNETKDKTSIFVIMSFPIQEDDFSRLSGVIQIVREKVKGIFIFNGYGMGLQWYMNSIRLGRLRSMLGDDASVHKISHNKKDDSFILEKEMENILLKTDKTAYSFTSASKNEQFKLLALLKWGTPLEFMPLTDK